jgi:hypothetical protein
VTAVALKHGFDSGKLGFHDGGQGWGKEWWDLEWLFCLELTELLYELGA